MFGCFAQSPVEHSWKDAVDAHRGGLQRRYTGTGSPDHIAALNMDSVAAQVLLDRDEILKSNSCPLKPLPR
jgi:hypothetical protein